MNTSTLEVGDLFSILAALAMFASSALVAMNAPMLKQTTLTGLHPKSATESAA